MSKNNILQDTQCSKLTEREKECLYWAAQGKSSEETAIILNIKPASVLSYRRLLKAKLNCYNIAQAVYKAAQLGILLNSEKPAGVTSGRKH